ncbi:MAG: hypothetical protein COU65_03235 [Candidatus Pacebacteria bacterium CG10_big_fil_rev_8_21_14_0_10_42_12]|nr:MAG: hypothetical protein COU65_03235 [Candidatus Pacebacteria bacterium CG10_big_fil_rev_8_21_14_0_10_42_12]
MYKIIIYFISFSLLTALIVGNIFVSGSLSTSGEDLRQLEQQKQELVEANAELKGVILHSTSLSSLQEKADALGYQRPVKVMALDIPTQTVAYNP